MLDVRFALRLLARTPGLTVLAVVLIALATGLNTALFSLLHASLLKPLPYRDSGRIVTVFESEHERRMAPLTPANFDAVRREVTSFEGVTGYRYHELELSGVDSPQRVTSLHALEGFFAFLGVPPLVGRTFGGGDFHTAASTEDGLWSIADVAVLSYGFWQRQFGGSLEAIGGKIRLNDKDVLVIGVMPEGFDALWRETDLYLPWILPPDFWSVRPPHVLPMLARLSPGVSPETAASEVATVYARLASEYPDTNEVLTASVEPLRSLFGNSTRAIVVLFTGALMVLVVACANLAGILATRARARAQEVAVRRALGASDGRIARQLLVEGALLASVGGIAGAIVAGVALDSLGRPMSLPFPPELSLPVLGFSVLLVVVTVLVIGLTPAWLVSRTDLAETLRGVGHESSRNLASAFVVLQVAIALGLVSASGLLLRSLAALHNERLGFEPASLLSVYVTLPDTRYPGENEQRQFRRRALEELRAIPGVISADTASHLPTTPMFLNLATAIEGRPLPRGTFRAAPVYVSRGVFRTLGIPIGRGRSFELDDTVKSPWVIVVNERMAREFWPGGPAVGKRIRLEYDWAPDAPLTVIGVVPNVKQEGVGHDVRPSFYILHEQFPQEWFYFAIKTTGDPRGILPAVRSRLRAVDPSLPVTDVKTMSERVADSLAEHRARTRLVALYASAGLFLATLGLYGTLTSLVGRRTRELVIRMALGASRVHVSGLVVRHGLKPLGVGIALGLVMAVLSRRFIESLLFGVASTDTATLVVTTSILMGAGLVAAILPAVRAARLELATRLRQE